MKLSESQAVAKERYSKMKKADLVNMLINAPVLVPPANVLDDESSAVTLKNQVAQKSVGWLWNTTNRIMNSTKNTVKNVTSHVKNIANHGWNSMKSITKSLKNTFVGANKGSNEEIKNTVLGANKGSNEEIKNNPDKLIANEENLYWKINELSNEADYDKVRQKILSKRQKHGKERYSKYLAMYFHNKINSLQDITTKLISVYKKENNSFKFHLSLGYLTERNTGENIRIDLYAPGRQYFNDQPTIIKNRKDMEDFVSEINRETIVRKISNRFPDTSTRLLGVYSMAVKVIKLEYPVGSEINLPDYIKNSKFIISLKNVKNNMCFWACMALAEGCRSDCFIRKSKELFNNFYKNKRKIEEYQGFDYVKELDKFEKINKNFAINIVSFNDDESIEYVRKSNYNSSRTRIYINLYLGHFSFIPSLSRLAKMYICNRCGAKSRDNNNLMKHIDLCTLKQQDTFEKSPKVYEKKRNEIVELCDWFDVNCDFRFDYLITYDLEAILMKINELSSKLKFVQKHVPLSVSIATNVPGFENEHFILSREPDTITEQMFEHFDKIAEKSRELMLKKMSPLIEKVNNHYNEKEKKRFLNTIDRYCTNIPIVGFNSSFYDTNLLMNHGFMKEIKKREPKLEECEPESEVKQQNDEAFILKNGTRYTVIKTKTFTFLDQMNYCAQGTSLRSFIRAHDVGQQKGHFPYEWLDCYSKLDCLISDLKISDFDSSLKNSKMCEDEFKQLMQTCKEENLIYIKDLLKWYNNLDVNPLLKACLKCKEFYYTFKLDMYKDAYTLPGLAEHILFQSALDGFDEYLKLGTPALGLEAEPNVGPPAQHHFIPTNIETKLERYKTQDLKAERALDNFIEKDEIMELFEKHKYCCYYCWCSLTANEKLI
jgi:hypothetical protein